MCVRRDQAIVARPNITGYISYHTFSGVHLRPYGGHDDDHFPTPDLRAYKLIGAEATKRTGYPAISIFHDFKYEPKETITGSTTYWFYDHVGVYSWTTEFWAPPREAGIEDYGYIEWMKDHPPEDDLKVLRWNDEKLDGKGYVDWYEFDHPQLGKVELGGWDVMYAWGNVPPHLLEQEIAPHSDWALWHLLISPRLEIKSLDDFPHFEFIRTPSSILPGLQSARAVMQNWLDEFLYMKKTVEWGVLTYTMHPYVIGRGYRMLGLEDLVEKLPAEGAVFMTMEEAAREAQTHMGLNAPC